MSYNRTFKFVPYREYRRGQRARVFMYDAVITLGCAVTLLAVGVLLAKVVRHDYCPAYYGSQPGYCIPKH